MERKLSFQEIIREKEREKFFGARGDQPTRKGFHFR
jgi:hypothetical protein